MTDGPEAQRSARSRKSDEPVENLASQALSVLASIRASQRVKADSKLAQMLRAAVLSPDPGEMQSALLKLKEAGHSDDAIVDIYVPHVARLLGEDWCRDDIGFADTSIGASRLQSVVRELTPRPVMHKNAAALNAGGSVAVLSDDTHTLGAMVLIHQLRRLGISVRVLVGAPHDEVLREIATDRYDAIFISSADSESLCKLKKFVETIKRQTQQNVPVVLGGRTIEFVDDVKEDTGADFATSSAEEAVRLCGLIAPARPHFRKQT